MKNFFGILIIFLLIFSCGAASEKSGTSTENVNIDQNPEFNGVESATAESVTEIALTWAAAADDVTPAESIAYQVCYSVSQGECISNFTPALETTGAQGINITGLLPDTTYYFVVRALDEAGNSDVNTIEVSAVTPADTTAPTFGGIKNVIAIGSSLTISFYIPFDDTTAREDITYKVCQTTVAGDCSTSFSETYTFTYNEVIDLSDNPGNEYRFEVPPGLASSTRYYYILRAVDSNGNTSTNNTEKNKYTLDFEPPVFAGIKTLTAQSETELSLTWDPATDASSITYSVYTSLTSGGQMSADVTGLTGTGYTLTGLVPDTTYYVKVHAVDSKGNTDNNSAEMSATTDPDTTAPAFGGITNAILLQNGDIRILWTQGTDDFDDQSDISYDVYTSTTSGGQNFSAAHTTATGVSYTDVSGLADFTEHFFVVRARDTVDNSETNTVEASVYKTINSTWTEKTAMTYSRFWHSSSETGGYIYVIGGNGNTQKLERYDPVAGTWLTRADLPSGRVKHCSAAVNSKVYTFGGEGSSVATLEYDPSGNSWATKTAIPTDRVFPACAAYNGKVYVIGGMSGSSPVTTVEEYDPASDTWTNCGSAAPSNNCNTPTGSITLASTASMYNGKIYYIGGENSLGSAVDLVKIYDIAGNSWSLGASMSSGVATAGSAVLNGYIYVVGGWTGTGTPIPLNTTREYNIAANTWRNVSSMTFSRDALSVSIVGNKIYAIGGGNGYGSKVEELQ